MRKGVFHGNRSLPRRRTSSSSLRPSSSFPQWINNDRQLASPLSVLARAAAASASASASSITPSTSSSSSQQQQQQLHQQQEPEDQGESAAAATFAGNHPANKPRASGGGYGVGGGGRRHPRPKIISSRSSRDRKGGHHASSSSNAATTRNRPPPPHNNNVPLAYRAQPQQQQQQDPKYGGGGDDKRRYPQQYQDNTRRNARHQPFHHRNASRFPSSTLSSSSPPPFTSNRSSRGGGGRGGAAATAAAPAVASKIEAMIKWEKKEQEQRQVKQYKAMIQQTEKELVELVQQDLVLLADQYRSVLNSNTNALSDSNSSNSSNNNNSDNKDHGDKDKNHHGATLQPKQHAWSSAATSSIFSDDNDDDASTARLVQSLMQTIAETLDDLHPTTTTGDDDSMMTMMEWSQIQETEDTFRQVCCRLQETVRKSCHVHPLSSAISSSRYSSSRNNNNSPMKSTKAATSGAASANSPSTDQDDDDDDEEDEREERLKDWMDLAACCLHRLDILITERTLLVETARKWKSSETPAASKPVGDKSSDVVDASSSSFSSSSSFKDWAISLLPSFLSSDSKETAKPATSSGVSFLFGSRNSREETEVNQEVRQQQHQSTRKEHVFMAHEDINLGPTQSLFRLAIESIASTIPQQQQQSQPLLSPSPLGESSESSAVVDPRVLAAANEEYRQALQSISDRLVQLFDLVPTDSTPDLTNVQTVLEITSLVGTLESARECSRIFKIATSAVAALSPPFRGSSPEHAADLIPFTLVLRAYHEAARFEKDMHKRIVVAEEAVELLKIIWNQRSRAIDRAKRITDATIVLHCMAMVMARACSSSSTSLNASTISSFCYNADNVFRRAVGNAQFGRFRDAVLAKDESSPSSSFTPNGSSASTSFAAIDDRILPLVNYLVRILALSGNTEGTSAEDESDGFHRLEYAKRMICKMISDCNRNSSSSVTSQTFSHSGEDESFSSTRRYMTLYPDVETVNAVIQGIVHRHRDQLQHPQDKRSLLLDSNLVQDDLKVATKLLDFTMSRRKVGIWPNDETFGGMSALLTVLKPSNVGEQLEKLLDQMETRRYFSQRLMPVTISLSVYHRVLWGLWQEAQLYKTEPRGTSQRAKTLLEGLEMRSTALWMTHDMVRKLQYSIAPSPAILLYDLGLKPTKRTFELVLHVCASTAAPSEFEMAASVAAKVVERMRQLGMTDESSVVSTTLRTCAERLPQNSDARRYVQSLLHPSSNERSISDDETPVEHWGPNVAARANAFLLEDDDDHDEEGIFNALLGESAAPPEGGNADDDGEDERIAFEGDGTMETAETLDTIKEFEKQEEEDDQEKSHDDDSNGSTLADGHGKTIFDDDGTLPEDSAGVAHSWIESIKDREDEFMKALGAGEISNATMVAMLVEIGAFKNEQDFIASNKDCRNLLHEWGTASPQSRPYCLLNRDQLLQKARDLGVKKAHAGWKEQTLLAKILEHHAAEDCVMMMEEGSNGEDAYKDQLLKKAKDLGIKKAHAGWKEQTLLAKILEHEGSVMMMEEGSNGEDAYKDQLLKKAKELGIKNAHGGWKEQTLLAKIMEHEGSVMMMGEGGSGEETSDSEERVASHIG